MRQLTETEILLSIKSESQKNKILNWINQREVEIETETRENIIDAISCLKNFLNEELEYCEKITELKSNSGLYPGLVFAKNNKIDRLIDLYNDSNTYNKINFIDSEIKFNKITTLEKVMLEIENFNFNTPIGFKMIVYTYDGEMLVNDIIPFNYNGLFNEFIDTSVSQQSTFKVANKNNVYIYSCIYDKNGYIEGTELKFEEGKHYSFTRDGHLVFDKDVLSEDTFIIKYQPNENSFEIDINKKVTNIELVFSNDFMEIGKNLKCRMVID
ncbi:MAG: hypothetical protein ACRCX2_09250 [Paraclostridium sp.]